LNIKNEHYRKQDFIKLSEPSEEIEIVSNELDINLEHEKEEEMFENFEEVKVSAIANQTRAVRKISIWLPSSDLSNIILTDLSGYYSALAYHKVQKDQFIKKGDAV
jgi:hypothetical protein